MSAIARYFDFENRGTTVGTELRGAVATFLTMAYILVANAMILRGAAPDFPFESCIACTAAAAGICCVLMGLVANAPIALASGMGLNAIVAYQVAGAAGSWQTAMGLVVLEMCDGQKSVRYIVQRFAKDYQLDPHEAERAVVTFLRSLIRKGLVNMVVKRH